MISKLIKNEIFHYHVEVMYSKNTVDMKKMMKKHMSSDAYLRYESSNSYDAVFYHNHELDMWFLFLWSKDIPVLAHEVLHIITRLCDSRWIPIRLENDEVMAYLMSWYMRVIWEFLYPKKKKSWT